VRRLEQLRGDTAADEVPAVDDETHVIRLEIDDEPVAVKR
jgi:hypothetical protein